MHRTVGVVLLGVGAVIVLWVISKTNSTTLGTGLFPTSGANPSPLTPRMVGYDANGKPIFVSPTTTPYGPANTGVQSGVTNDLLLAGGLANFGSSILRLFGAGSPATQGQITPAAAPPSTLSAADMGTPTIADQGISVSGGTPPIFGPFPTPAPGTVYGPPAQTAQAYGPPSPTLTDMQPPLDPLLSAAQMPLSAANNPVNYVDFGIPNPVPPASPGYIPGGGNGFTANDFSGYTVPSTVVDLTGVAAPPPPPPDPTVLAI